MADGRFGCRLFSNSGPGVMLSMNILAGFRVLSAVGVYPPHERMAAARRAARTEREAGRKAERTRAELSAELRRLSLDAVKTMIRARGGKIHLYSVAQLQAQADALIGPWLVAQAKERIARRAEAERNSKDLHKSRRPAAQGLFLCAYPEQNREAK